MPKSTRTFVALPIPEPNARKLAALQEKLAPKLPGVRWGDPANFHITLNFLGEVDDTDLHLVCRSVAEAARGVEVFDVGLQSLGVFPSPARPRVIWIGLKDADASPLIGLHGAVAKALDSLGYRTAESKFHPHVTLGRVKNDRSEMEELPALLDAYRAWSAGAFKARELIVYASNFGGDGPVVYTSLGRASFRSARSGENA